LGITHVHLLPTFYQYAIDETHLETPQFNWGYDPQNYNVQEGSFSSNPYDAEVRIEEFKTIEDGLVSYEIKRHTNGDSWKDILVLYNTNTTPFNYTLDDEWQLAAIGDEFSFEDGKTITQSIMVPAISMLVATENS